MPETVTSQTGGGGFHYLFKYPGPVRNSAGKLDNGLDIRADGGYIVAPISVHGSGNAYRWAEGLSPDEVSVAETPEWLLKALESGRVQESGTSAEPTNDNGSGKTLTEGKRNAALTSLAGSMRWCGMSEAAILAALLAENRGRCDPPLDDQEVKGIAVSISQYPPGADNKNYSSHSGDTGDDELEPHSYSILSLPDLLSLDIHLEWLVDPILPLHGVTILSGDPGCGKSWLAMTLALAVGMEEKWLGHFDVKQGTVLYLDCEGSLPGLKNRFGALTTALGFDHASVPVKFLHGQQVDLRLPRSRIGLEKLIEDVHPTLIIVDSVIRVHTANENAAIELAQIHQFIKRWVDDYGCAVLLIDHLRKFGAVSNAPAQRLRGSTEKWAFASSMLSVNSTKRDGRRVEHTKSRDAEPLPNPFRFDIREEGESLTVTYEGEVEALDHEAAKEQAEELILEALKEGEMRRQVLLSRLGEASITERTARRALEELVGADAIVSAPDETDKRHMLYSLPNGGEEESTVEGGQLGLGESEN